MEESKWNNDSKSSEEEIKEDFNTNSSPYETNIQQEQVLNSNDDVNNVVNNETTNTTDTNSADTNTNNTNTNNTNANTNNTDTNTNTNNTDTNTNTNNTDTNNTDTNTNTNAADTNTAENDVKEIRIQTSSMVQAPALMNLPPQPFDSQVARQVATNCIHKYFTTQFNPLTRHHIDSYNQFIQRDLRETIRSHNPILLLKNPKETSKTSEALYEDKETKKKYFYYYNVELYIGGESGSEIFVGTPTITLDQGQDVRTLFPNEARLRNLTYSIQIKANILARVTRIVYEELNGKKFPKPIVNDILINDFILCSMPLMLHSAYCILHGKPSTLLQQMGECPKDQGGYFIIDGSEKVLVTRQEGAFNTLWIDETPVVDLKNQYIGKISSLNPKTRVVKYVEFYWTRDRTSKDRDSLKASATEGLESVLEIRIPFVMKPIPIFVLFRALGIQSDKAILELIYPDFKNPEAKYNADLLIPSINAARPFLDTYSSVQYIKSLTKLSGELGGVGEARVLDILHNQLFPHIEDLPFARVTFLADCVRKMLRVIQKIDAPASRDDTRNQRLLTSGFLCQMLFENIYKTYIKTVKLNIDEAFSYNESIYSGEQFLDIFSESNRRQIFAQRHITEGLMRGFKGKWLMGANKEESGLLQELDRMSYLNFISHLRHAILNFDTGMKLQGPRRLNPSQYGYFCTSETPSGSSIGITKNLSIMTAISTGSYSEHILEWLFSSRGGSIIKCEYSTPSLSSNMIPVYLNSGIIGYSANPKLLARVLRLMKRGGFLPPLSSSGFSIPERKLFIYIDDGRPLRPLIICEPRGKLPFVDRFQTRSTWRDLVVGTLRPYTGISSQEFVDPLEGQQSVTLESYLSYFNKHMDKLGIIEYIDPYEQNEILLANWPEHIIPETSHMEVHPSTILGLLGNMIPYPNHNQSPRNQLSASQSKQGVSLYATNWKNRFDNTANVLCYGQAPLSRTIYQDYIGDGQMSYGQNIILAMAMYGGYNQEDGIIMNADAMARGQFRSMNYRSYETFEEDDKLSNTQTRIGNPRQISGWLNIKVSNDYSKLDDSGIIKTGSYVTQTTVLVGRYMTGSGEIKDASITPQVWTRGRVESVVVTVNNAGLRLVKIRIVQDRVPELGDKFCLTPDHDVLTKTGWKSIVDITTNDFVAQLNKEKNSLEYVQPLDTFKFDHTGTMYEVNTQGVSLCTTLNHRMWIQTRYSNQYELIEAKDMIGKRVQFSSYSPILKEDSVVSIGNTSLTNSEMTSFITLFGIWIAEGWVYINEKDYIHRLEISANKPIVQEILKNVCSELNLKSNFVESSKKFYINSKEYAEYFKSYNLGAIHKRLPSWCFELSQKQSQQLLAALCAGDGHETLTSLHYGTSSIGLRDDIQILAQHAGYTSRYTMLMKKGDVHIGKNNVQFKANADHWGIYIRRKRLYPTLNHGHKKTQNGQSEKIVEYTGNIYCLSVPSEVFLVRRNGAIVWTGNSNRHGQKGTINVFYRGHDMPRTADGITPDMIMNPTAIPSRMTIGQILEMILGNVSVNIGAIGNCTAFMNDGSPHEYLGTILENLGLHKRCNQVLYNGITGEQITADIFMGVVYGMRLKHMTEDKWNARGQGRREQRTHQPTGGRGNEGGLKIGEMERDAIVAHGVASFIQESYMLRSDGTSFIVCNKCGTIPIYNEKTKLYICSLCDGPIQYSGDTVHTLNPIPSPIKSAVSFSKINIPYATKLFFQEIDIFMNIGTRFLTTHDVTRLKGMDTLEELAKYEGEATDGVLPKMVYLDTVLPELQEPPVLQTAAEIFDEITKLQDDSDTVQQPQGQEGQIQQPQGQIQPPQPQEFQQIQQQPQGQDQIQPPQPQEPQQIQQQPQDVIQLAPQSIIPGSSVFATTDAGVPILNIDTSDSALAEIGLKQPSDATKSILPEQPQQPQQPQQQPRRRLIRQKPQQQGGQWLQQPQQQQQQQQQEQQQEPQQQQKSQQIIVEKLG